MVDRATYDAARRRLPVVEVDDDEFTGPDGAVTLVDLLGDHYLLLLQHVMFGPDWDEGPSEAGTTHLGVLG